MARVQINQLHKHAYETYDVTNQYTVGNWRQGSAFVDCGEPAHPPVETGLTANEIELQDKESSDGLILPTDGLVEIGIGFDNSHTHDFLEPPESVDIELESINLYGDLSQCYEGHDDCNCAAYQYYLTSGYRGAILIAGDGSLSWQAKGRAVNYGNPWNTAIGHWHHHTFNQYTKVEGRDGHTFSACPLGHTGCLLTKVFDNKNIAGANLLDYEGKSGVADFAGGSVYNGVGTLFLTEFSVGDWICPTSYRTYWWEWKQIEVINSDTDLDVIGTFPISQTGSNAKKPYKWDGSSKYYLTDDSEDREINE
jgi:hypothetical protein